MSAHHWSRPSGGHHEQKKPSPFRPGGGFLSSGRGQAHVFPFVIAVLMYTKEGILFEFNRRLQNVTQTEFANDLQNVYIITRLRLNKLLDAN
jgi:hypothetical protein